MATKSVPIGTGLFIGKQAPRGGMVGGPSVTELTGVAPILSPSEKRARASPQRFSAEIPGRGKKKLARRGGLSDATNGQASAGRAKVPQHSKPNGPSVPAVPAILDKRNIALIDGVPAYEVESILDRRETANGNEEYLVCWYGYGKHTWVPLHNLNCPDKLDEFYCQHQEQRSRKLSTESVGFDIFVERTYGGEADEVSPVSDAVDQLQIAVHKANANAVCLRNVYAQIDDDSHKKLPANVHIPHQIARLQDYMIVIPGTPGEEGSKPAELQRRLDDNLRAYQKSAVPILAEWWEHEASLLMEQLTCAP
jgi:hypothetical protein